MKRYLAGWVGFSEARTGMVFDNKPRLRASKRRPCKARVPSRSWRIICQFLSRSNPAARCRGDAPHIGYLKWRKKRAELIAGQKKLKRPLKRRFYIFLQLFPFRGCEADVTFLVRVRGRHCLAAK